MAYFVRCAVKKLVTHSRIRSSEDAQSFVVVIKHVSRLICITSRYCEDT